MGKTKDDAAAPLTMAQELAALLDMQDEENPSLTVRQALCRSLIEQAKKGNFRVLEWIYNTSDEGRREYLRKHPFAKVFAKVFDSV